MEGTSGADALQLLERKRTKKARDPRSLQLSRSWLVPISKQGLDYHDSGSVVAGMDELLHRILTFFFFGAQESAATVSLCQGLSLRWSLGTAFWKESLSSARFDMTFSRHLWTQTLMLSSPSKGTRCQTTLILHRFYLGLCELNNWGSRSSLCDKLCL